MTKISDLKFKTKVLSDEEKYSFNELDSVCTAVIKKGFPFEIIVVRMDERDFHEEQYVINLKGNSNENTVDMLALGNGCECRIFGSDS